MSFSSDPSYPLFPIFAFLGFFLVLIPLPWHLQAWNAGTCLYMIWAAISCLNQFVNSVVWHANALNPAPVWCDISSRIIVGVAVAIPAASLCINRRLYKIATSSYLSVTKAQKRRAIHEDLVIGLGIPIIQMALHYVVNGHRFDIYEDVGCWPATVNVWLTYPLVLCWPVVIGLISATYCILTLIAFWKRKARFSEMISSNTSLTLHRYFRLMALATIELLCTTPFSAYFIYLDATSMPISPYKGWADLHFNYSRVDQVPSVIWRLSSKEAIALELTRWLMVVCALVFFLFFGFAEEARRHYKMTFWRIAKIFGYKPKTAASRRISIGRVPKMMNVDGTSSLPVYVTKQHDIMHDSSSTVIDISSRLSTKPTLTDISIPSSAFDSSPREEQRKTFSEVSLASPSSSSEKEGWYNGTYGHAY